MRSAAQAAGQLAELFDNRLAIECWDHALPEERALVRELIPLAESLGLPWIVANDVSKGVMGSDRNQVHLITADGTEAWQPMSKAEVARRLAERIADALA